ncbi:MAG TPA: PAS domain S-box protein [Pseudomonadales bacterium]
MDEPSTVRGYGLALLAVALATLIRWLLEPWLGAQAPFLTYIAAVALVGIYAGIGPAIAVAVGGAIATFWWLAPAEEFTVDSARHWIALLLFALTSAVIAGVAHRLRSSNAYLAALVSTAHEAIVTCNLDGFVTGWNAGAERVYGYPSEEMIGCSIERLSPPTRSREARWIIAEIQAGRPVEALDTERLRKDGRRIDVLLSAAPIRDGRGRVVGVASIERDVTERKRGERARRASESRLRAIIDNSPVVLFIKDLEGRYFLVNRSYAELWGTTVERLLGITDEERFPPEVAERYRRNDRAVIASGEPCTFEETAEVNGELRTFLSTKFPLHDDQGQIYAVCGIAADITEEARRHEALLDLDRRKDQFLSMLAHELRNPLAPIANAVRLIRLQEGLDPRVAWAGEVIERQVRHLTRMVDDLLDLARFNTGRVRLRREVIDLVPLLRGAAEDRKPRFESEGVRLSVELPADPVWVEADGARIVQVLDNLLDNAAKYTDRGGQVWLRLEAGDRECVLTVRDTGIGIDPAHLDHIFELFEQADVSFDRSSGGLGLGLNLVKRMVEMHGGTVRASSEGRGTGSTMIVRLPLSRAPEPMAADPDQRAAPGQRRTLLVVEDNPDTARSMELLLQALGHDVRVARTGQAGIALADERVPELMLIDLGLPDMDGYQVARAVRQRFGDRLRLVALTGYGQEEHRRRSREAGFDEHLLKPLSLEALQRILERAPRESAGIVA